MSLEAADGELTMKRQAIANCRRFGTQDQELVRCIRETRKFTTIGARHSGPTVSHLVARLSSKIKQVRLSWDCPGSLRRDGEWLVRQVRFYRYWRYCTIPTYIGSRSTSSCGVPAIICLQPLQRGGHHHAVLLSKLPIGSKPERYRSGRRMRSLKLMYVPKADSHHLSEEH